MKWMLISVAVFMLGAALEAQVPATQPDKYPVKTYPQPEFATVPTGYKVFASGDFLEQLQENAKPNLFNGDFLWITRADDGGHLFTLAHPYGIGTDKARQYVILDAIDPAKTTPAIRARVTATLDRTLNPNAISGTGPYATVLSMDTEEGTLYQLGFPVVAWRDHKTIIERRLVVMHDPDHGWRYVASPFEDGILFGGPESPTAITTKAEWTKIPAEPLRLEFHFTRTATLPGVAPLETSYDEISIELGQVTSVARPYHVMQKGENFTSLAGQLAAFSRGEKVATNAAVLVEALKKLNPDTDPTKIPVGAHITIPSRQEAGELQTGKITLARIQQLPLFDLSDMSAGTPEEVALLAVLLGDGSTTTELPVSQLLESYRQQIASVGKADEIYGAAKVNLSGGKSPELIYNTDVTILPDGTKEDLGGATGNHAFAIVQQLPSGRARLVLSAYGTGPYPQDTRTNGWRDLEVGYHISAQERASSIYHFDGKVYR